MTEIEHMEHDFDPVKDIAPIPGKNWCIKVRILRMWRVPSYEKNNSHPSMELVVLDKEGCRIHCLIRSFHYRLFEPIVDEGKVYVLTNFTIESNALKFKPTKHEMRIIFKRDTLVSPVQDANIPVESFEFLPAQEIISSARDDMFLIDFIGLLSAKSELIPFEKKGKQSHYMKIELDDLSGSEKLSCTLWETYASDFVNLIEASKASEYIIVLQFTKMKFYNGVMTITNTNFTTKIMVNADLEVVKKFRQRLNGLGNKHKTDVQIIGRVVRHDPADDFLSLTSYGCISHIKATVEKATFVTCGSVIDVDRNHAWWYKACKRCNQGLEALTDQFYCPKCDVYASAFVARFCIQVRVVDKSDTATFVLFENSASKFLGVSAADLRCVTVAKGYGKDYFPAELDALICKTMLFKLTARLDSLNKFQPCVITVSRICDDAKIIALFASQHNLNLAELKDMAIALGDCQRTPDGFGGIGRVAGSTTPPNLRDSAVCVVDCEPLVAHTPVKRACIRTSHGGPSHGPSTASKNLLPTFEKHMTKHDFDARAEDI